jgi:ATP-dependent RNA helicase HelY
VRVRAITPERRVLSLGPRDFAKPPRPVARVDLPTPYAPNSHGFQRQVASALIAARLRTDEDSSTRQRPGPSRAEAEAEAAAAAAGHPVASCPDLALHLRAADRADRLARDAERQEQRIRGRTESLARQFDRVLRVLEAWGYVDGWSLTDRGTRLARLYHESDLLVAEALAQGFLDDLSPAEVAGLVSTFTYEPRGPGEEPATWFPTSTAHSRWVAIDRLARELAAAEEDAGLPVTRAPEPGFLPLAWAWASGRDLDDVMGDDEVSGGDFVRNVKQLIDLLRQLGDVAPAAPTGRAAREAADALFRGIVAASSVVTGAVPAESTSSQP